LVLLRARGLGAAELAARLAERRASQTNA